jgi:hypothetical protein
MNNLKNRGCQPGNMKMDKSEINQSNYNFGF